MRISRKRRMPAFTACLIILCACAVKNNKEGYRMFLGDLKHSGIYHSPEITGKPAIKWAFRTGGYVNGSAVCLDDHIFFGSGDGNLYCVAAANGKQVWKYQTGGAVFSTPAISNGIIFFGSHDGNFYALDAAAGTLKWSFKTKGEKYFSAKGIHGQLPHDSLFTDQWDFWLSSPAVMDHTVYFGSGDGNFYALDEEKGTEKWSFKTNGIIHSSPALADGKVYFGGWDTYLHALDAATGKEIWKFKTGEDTAIYNQTGITGSPLLSGGMLYFGCRDSHLYALDAATGKLVWTKYNGGGWISLTPVVSGDKLIYLSGSDHRVSALNKLTGDSIYRAPILTGVFSSPSIAGKSFYYGDMNGFVSARNISDGKEVWSLQLPGSVRDSFHIFEADHRNISDPGFQAAIENNKGKIDRMGIRLSVGNVLSSLLINEGVIYVGTTDGNLYALQ